MRTCVSKMLSACCVLALAAGAAQAGAVTFVIEPGSGAPGKEAEVTVAVRSAEGLGALEMEISYDAEALEVKGVTAGRLASGAMLEWKTAQPGSLRIAMTCSQPVSGEGELLKVAFSVAAGKDGDSPLKVSARAWDSSNPDPLPMLVETRDGTFTVKDDGAQTGGGLPGWAIGVMAGVGAVLVLVVVLVVVLAARKK